VSYSTSSRARASRVSGSTPREPFVENAREKFFMSSSRRKSRSDKAAGPCPNCGSRRITSVVEDVEFRVGRKRVRFAGVLHEKCPACGERVFDLETSRRFDAALGRRRRRAA
jgi:YgiT-type zinc finger domain-containing protein